jgi:hypothetical protein
MLKEQNPALAATSEPGSHQQTQTNLNAVSAYQKRLLHLGFDLVPETSCATPRVVHPKLFESYVRVTPDNTLRTRAEPNVLNGKNEGYLHQNPCLLADYAVLRRRGK